MREKTESEILQDELEPINHSEPNDKLYNTWDHVRALVYHIYVNIIAEKNDGAEHYKHIVGVSRGGLIPGVMLSHMLGATFKPLVWQTRDGKFKDTLTAIELQHSKELDRTLFVDDICDSGLTIKQIREWIPESQWAVLHQKAEIDLDFVGKRLYNNTQWIVYPWETN